MSAGSERPWPRARGSVPILRLLLNLPNFVRLYWRLLKDHRVSVWPKALLLLSVLYVLSPVDFIPDVIPFIGEVDDLMIVGLAC
ncbi:MAG TPA: YkvA family protein, partial [Candidatus Acidoferrales bacterium]|nr:YkvA family protein [Candidatus Acidoferrales bacterium]